MVAEFSFRDTGRCVEPEPERFTTGDLIDEKVWEVSARRTCNGGGEAFSVGLLTIRSGEIARMRGACVTSLARRGGPKEGAKPTFSTSFVFIGGESRTTGPETAAMSAQICCQIGVSSASGRKDLSTSSPPRPGSTSAWKSTCCESPIEGMECMRRTWTAPRLLPSPLPK
jgi:hypothetical protein